MGCGCGNKHRPVGNIRQRVQNLEEPTLAKQNIVAHSEEKPSTEKSAPEEPKKKEPKITFL